MLDRYFYLSSLPALGELGTEPPLGFGQLLELLSGNRALGELVGAIFLWDDLLQREAVLAGEPVDEPDPCVLTVQQVRGEHPLPGYLATAVETEPQVSLGIAADRLWDAYFRHVLRVARQLNSHFLAAWCRAEVTLRNTLATIRAQRLGLEPTDYLVATDLTPDFATAANAFDGVISEWAASSTPVVGQQVLLRARWAWVANHDAWFSFHDDELGAYAARLALLARWQRITAAPATSQV